ncbi:hypothetical protein OY671_011354, partial [Metschnikowia pulcherrima]
VACGGDKELLIRRGLPQQRKLGPNLHPRKWRLQIVCQPVRSCAQTVNHAFHLLEAGVHYSSKVIVLITATRNGEAFVKPMLNKPQRTSANPPSEGKADQCGRGDRPPERFKISYAKLIAAIGKVPDQ